MDRSAGSARLKLLIDEMYPPSIAAQLRGRGHDADAVTERSELRALADRDLFSLAQQQRRAVVTENIADFSLLANDYDRRGAAHFGLVLVSRDRYPRARKATIGRMVTALERVLDEQPEQNATSLRHWL